MQDEAQQSAAWHRALIEQAPDDMAAFDVAACWLGDAFATCPDRAAARAAVRSLTAQAADAAEKLDEIERAGWG
jgi:hypothetical protein